MCNDWGRRLLEKGIPGRQLARDLGIPVTSALDKFQKRADLTVGEAKVIRRLYFPGEKLEDLFGEKSK